MVYPMSKAYLRMIKSQDWGTFREWEVVLRSFLYVELRSLLVEDRNSFTTCWHLPLTRVSPTVSRCFITCQDLICSSQTYKPKIARENSEIQVDTQFRHQWLWSCSCWICFTLAASMISQTTRNWRRCNIISPTFLCILFVSFWPLHGCFWFRLVDFYSGCIVWTRSFLGWALESGLVLICNFCSEITSFYILWRSTGMSDRTLFARASIYLTTERTLSWHSFRGVLRCAVIQDWVTSVPKLKAKTVKCPKMCLQVFKMRISKNHSAW